MKGKLKYDISGHVGTWVVEYQIMEQTYPRSGRDMQGNEQYGNVDKVLPLETDGTQTLFSGEEVEFEIISVYVEPDDSIHCNRGADVKYARIIIDDSDKKWNQIFSKWNSITSSRLVFFEWLKKNYKAPDAKSR